MIRVGLVGARGYVGREMIAALDSDLRFDLAFASSRAMAGRELRTVPGLEHLSRFGSHRAGELSADDVAGSDADVIVLGLPNGLAAPYVEALDREGHPGVVIDLSADHRHQPGWVYGSPELRGEQMLGAKRIANPGCYATAANLALAPLEGLVAGRVSVFGLSGFSGAGTTPGLRNDPERLENNVQPYGFGGHGHEAEIAATTGCAVTFAPHVAGFFRGLLVTLTVPLSDRLEVGAVAERFGAFYQPFPRVAVREAAPEIRDVAGRDGCVIGGFAVSGDVPVLTLSSALDNLRKGAATQAIENMEKALGMASWP
ncbi:Asd/ArgC dimerization domain-containing protein [Parvularcula lutaonensis]|uniref:Asd/ArgC dimerization domain-containing protein n=1 Tax=Parvularcula lutaonensis TaxID=491923 RepID=A0ABV7M6U6_9PROT|nr:Asd/ArgC dimerization domain-containing protein [Parvularcula lutaonensis]GGY56652.1 N-acetyl-gamma-glutamyl-phosphate reductase [Parvularcula lutaonensis]